MAQLQEQLEGLPGYDIISGYYDDFADKHFNRLDPYEDKDGSRLKLSKQYSTPEEQRLWKSVQSKAWTHDKCFLGSCGVGLDCGLGLAPLVVLLFPALGPLLMYVVHLHLVNIVHKQVPIPPKLMAKLNSQIIFDLIITFPPLIGCFFGWLHGCSTRNAAHLYNYLDFVGKQRQQMGKTTYIGTDMEPIPQPSYQPSGTTKQNKWKAVLQQNQPNKVEIRQEQQTGFL